MAKDKDKEKSKEKSKDSKKKSDKSEEKSKEGKKEKKSKKDKDDKKSAKDDSQPEIIAEIPQIEEQILEAIPPPPIEIVIPVVIPEERFCLRHKQTLKYFCESCEDPVCEHCTIQGPHNSQLHRINQLQDSFNRRAGKLSFSIENNLKEKAMLLGAQLHRVEYRIEEIKYVQTIIERDVRVEFGGIIERINSAEGVKLSILYHEIENLQRELSSINEIGSTFFELIRDTTNPVPFLLQSRRLYENAQAHSEKQLKQDISVYPYDFPKELQEIREKLQSVQLNEALAEQKDEIIWKLLKEKDNYDTYQGAAQFEEDTNNEIQEWAKLADSYTAELKQCQLICYFCGVPGDESFVNKKCKENNKAYSPSILGMTQKQPKVKFYGNKWHFFAKPLDTETITRVKQIKQAQFPLIEMQQILKVATEKSVNLEEKFQELTDQEGYVTNVKFCGLFIKELEFHTENLERVIGWLDPGNFGKVSSQYFLKALKEIPADID